jgi:hypothetical protein
MRAVAEGPRRVESPGAEAGARNRRTVRVLLSIVAALAVATILAGIRW